MAGAGGWPCGSPGLELLKKASVRAMTLSPLLNCGGQGRGVSVASVVVPGSRSPGRAGGGRPDATYQELQQQAACHAQ
jgi:hypothetical protein